MHFPKLLLVKAHWHADKCRQHAAQPHRCKCGASPRRHALMRKVSWARNSTQKTEALVAS